jgi:hypothetical protein
MSDPSAPTRPVALSAGGALGLSALAAALGACCIAPWTVAVVGVAGAVWLARLSFLAPWLLVAALALLGAAFWAVYRRAASCANADCAATHRLRRLRISVWLAAAAVLGLAALPHALLWFARLGLRS